LIRPVRPDDAEAIAAIYNPFIRDTVVTFEETPVDAAEMARRIEDVTARLPWLVSEQEGVVAGYAYATRWRPRSAYRFAVESTIYMAPAFVGRGLGTTLYRTLLEELERGDVHCAVGGVALPNPASVALHVRLGFQPIGTFREIGWKLGRRVDVGYWQRVF